MVELLERKELISLLQKKGQHDTGQIADVLPFSSSKKTRVIRNQFQAALGEYIRNISGLKFDKTKFADNELFTSREGHPLSESIAKDVTFNQVDDQHDFVRFINAFLFDKDKINPIHPYLFNLTEVPSDHENEFRKYGQFMQNVLVGNCEEIKEIFVGKESDDILTELILSKIEDLKIEKNNRKSTKHYQPLLEPFTKLYQDDLLYLSKYKDYFLTAFPLLTHYYIFMYVCQLLIKFEQFTDADYSQARPIYFALEWEVLSKRRKAADEIEGFKYIKEKHINLFPHIHTISQLSYNKFNKNENEKSFIPYSELYGLIKSEGEEFEAEFLAELKLWIKQYTEWAKIAVEDDSTTIPQAFNILFCCIKERVSTDVSKRYGGNLEDLGTPFIKARGSIGNVLNVKHDFLLLMTAVCVKEKRMPLNELFVELEKRGIAFDRYSKNEIIKLFDNHNIIEKKSDSGDAQYVKPIL